LVIRLDLDLVTMKQDRLKSIYKTLVNLTCSSNKKGIILYKLKSSYTSIKFEFKEIIRKVI